MKKYDLISSFVWIVVAGLFCNEAIDLGLGNFNEPGPGFFPFLISIFMICFSLLLIISCLKTVGKFEVTVSNTLWQESDSIKRILLVVILLFMYVFALNYVGFVLTTFVFMFLILFFEQQKWTKAFLGAGLTTSFCYALFQVLLKVQLPVGPLGF
jgi:putative tricarboxylic transport membrane protein